MATAALLTRTLAARDPDEAGHAARVTALALRLAEAVGAGKLHIEAIRAGGPLHDIGKLAVDPAILHKPAALEPEELEQIRAHPVAGTRMLAGIGSLRPALDCVLHHHERWDGDGYPHALSGAEIPLEARILAVADAYDAMTTDRPYRSAISHEAAVAEVGRCAGAQFDPVIAEVFVSL
jgi:HD-GYP domain-containing protein (c-di-GMP phosphodiesterase class II)